MKNYKVKEINKESDFKEPNRMKNLFKDYSIEFLDKNELDRRIKKSRLLGTTI